MSEEQATNNIQEQPDQSTDLTMTSRKNFSPMGEADCQFCGVVREKLDSIFLTWNLYKPCECEGARADRAERARLEEERQREERERERAQVVRRYFAEIPRHFQDRTFDSYRVADTNKEAFDLAQSWPPTEGKQSLLFMGPPGTGKTHLAAAIAIRQAERARSVIFGTVPSILGRIKDTFNKGESATEAEVKNAISNCSLLVLDDLGKEKPSEWVEETLYEIINNRYTKRLPVIITTNVGLKSVEARYQWNGEAIVSRLFEMCTGVKVGGNDHRRQRQ